jgi:hypothetical protein
MLGVNVYPADQGDTACLPETLETVKENLKDLGDASPELLCVVTDKGYHKAQLIKGVNLDQVITTYIPERETTKRRKWRGDLDARREFHANRRRTRGNEGKRLGRLRSELVERSFALTKCSGNLSRMMTRGMDNVTKRYLIHAAAYNLSLVMRSLFGHGTPKGLAGALKRLIWALLLAMGLKFAGIMSLGRPWRGFWLNMPKVNLEGKFC